MQPKKVLMIAGPNGAGKTTSARAIISSFDVIYEFINADEIARGLAPMHPESMALTSSKLMLKRFKELLENQKSFAFETTAAATNYVRHLKKAKNDGFEFNLLFLWLESPELAIERVKQRVVQGGHHIPEDVIRRRYNLGLKNLVKHYLPIADTAIILDNSRKDDYKVIARKTLGKEIKIENSFTWQEIEKGAHGKK